MEPGLTSTQRRVIDLVADVQLSAGDGISGRRLRARVPTAEKKNIAVTLESLIPQHLEQTTGDAGDFYRLTFEGLLRSRWAPRATKLIDGLLRLLAARFAEDPDVRAFTWAEVKRASGLVDADFRLAAEVIALARLARGAMNGDPGSPDSWWGVPVTIEALAQMRDVSDYLRYRAGEDTGMAPAERPVEAAFVPRPAIPVPGRVGAPGKGRIFIGHGRSSAWRDLKDFITERLGLDYEEFNRESVAGRATKERLQEMLDAASFAFLVMTAEDEHADGTKHARANVIHEAGLFQGRLGFERAIVLLEEGCEGFSNIAGLTHLGFPKGNIRAVSEEIRRVLEREGVLAPSRQDSSA